MHAIVGPRFARSANESNFTWSDSLLYYIEWLSLDLASDLCDTGL